MAALAGDLTKQILGQSDAAKAFRPWWDKVEDGIMYSMVIMGKTELFNINYCIITILKNVFNSEGMITLPMTFLTGTPLECAIHPDLWFLNSTSTTDQDPTDLLSKENLARSKQIFRHYPKTYLSVFQPRYARILKSYSKKYCTEMHVSPFLLYFPFSLFLVPLLIVFIERVFIR